MNFYDATDVAAALLPRRIFRLLAGGAVLVVAALLWSPLLSTRGVGTWLHTQATQKVQADLAPIVDHLQLTLTPSTTLPTGAGTDTDPIGGA